jgi:dTDP-4-amino-4,6-dideoxygalactose transaminase
MYEKSLLIRDCGIDRTIFGTNWRNYPACDISLIGHSATMSNLNGYIGCRQMEFVSGLLEKQREQAGRWDSFLLGKTDYIPVVAKTLCQIIGVRRIGEGLTEGDRKLQKTRIYASGVHITATGTAYSDI